MRTFTLNSQEFYEAVCEPRERPWIPNGALPREPQSWGPTVIVEPRGFPPLPFAGEDAKNGPSPNGPGFWHGKSAQRRVRGRR
jgi:hypothetical protein